jgi:hypothetical protein
MKLSIVTPVVSLHPGAHGPWEVDATIEDVALVAETADRLAYHYLTCSEHIAIPATELDRRAGRATATRWPPSVISQPELTGPVLSRYSDKRDSPCSPGDRQGQ